MDPKKVNETPRKVAGSKCPSLMCAYCREDGMIVKVDEPVEINKKFLMHFCRKCQRYLDTNGIIVKGELQKRQNIAFEESKKEK